MKGLGKQKEIWRLGMPSLNYKLLLDRTRMRVHRHPEIYRKALLLNILKIKQGRRKGRKERIKEDKRDRTLFM